MHVHCGSVSYTFVPPASQLGGLLEPTTVAGIFVTPVIRRSGKNRGGHGSRTSAVDVAPSGTARFALSLLFEDAESCLRINPVDTGVRAALK